jgi:hypothetical protein
VVEHTRFVSVAEQNDVNDINNKKIPVDNRISTLPDREFSNIDHVKSKPVYRE